MRGASNDHRTFSLPPTYPLTPNPTPPSTQFSIHQNFPKIPLPHLHSPLPLSPKISPNPIPPHLPHILHTRTLPLSPPLPKNFSLPHSLYILSFVLLRR